MKKKFALFFTAIFVVITMASCTKEEPSAVYNPIDYISVPRGEYKIRNGVAYAVRYSISNQSNRTLYYCKFRVTQCYESGTEFYSKVYEVGSKTDMTQWTLAPGDIDFTDYYECDFLFKDDGHIKDNIIDAKFY